MGDLLTAGLGEVRPPLLWGFAGLAGVLVLASLAVLFLQRTKPDKDWTELRLRVQSWWVMIAAVALALALGWAAMTVLFAAVSFVALREILSLAPLRREDRLIVLWAYLTVPLTYGLVALDQYRIYLVAIPVWFFLVTPFLMAIAGQTRAYLATVATITWAVIVCVFNLAVLPLLMKVPAEEAPAGAAGLVFLLLLTTEANDVFQFLCGKAFGRRKILPTVSPNKTWEGFVGGWFLTAGAFWLLAPVFTPLSAWQAAVVALLLPVAGFAGDVTMSAVKRDLGVKDTSRLIPGHGGLLDRIDSLTFTAPLFFHLVAYYALTPTEPGEAARPHSWVRQAFLTGLARPFVRFLTGMDVVGRERLPLTGPAIIAANHASHMDAFMLLSLFPAKTLAKVRPVAAADYFLANPAISWVSLNLIGISPISRKVKRGEDVLAPARRALERGEIILVFPEGTRGSGQGMGDLKGGVARLAEAYPAAPVIPIWIQGADRVLPKGTRTPVPMNCTALVGEPLVWEEGQDRPGFTVRLRERLEALAASAPPQKWS